MKSLRLALLVLAAGAIIARAQDDDRRAPPVEIPDFSNLDEYIYEPKSTVRLGFRYIGGANTEFSGQGSILRPEDVGPATGANIARYYHDGEVLPDSRTTVRLDSSGNPMIDPQTGAPARDPIAPDGRTNTWGFLDDRQAQAPFAPNGFISFHSYSAQVIDTAIHGTKSRSTAGLDIAVSRDMGKLFGSRVGWNLVGGMSVNDISARKIDTVAANIETITDLYSLFGQNAPAAPYTAPANPSSHTVTNPDGTTQVITVDNTVLIGNEPYRTVETTSGDVLNNWKLKGSYYTFRGGAELMIPITSRFRATITLAGALVYAGTNYSVTQTFTPFLEDEISGTEASFGADMVQMDTTSAYKLLPGFYADASVQYDLTDKAGFFAGAIFQSAKSYKQNLDTETAHYTSKVDLSNQNGVRAGMSIRF